MERLGDWGLFGLTTKSPRTPRSDLDRMNKMNGIILAVLSKRYVKEPIPQSGTRQALAHRVRILAENDKMS